MANDAVSVARAADKTAIANMMQLYVHDFSAHWAGTARGELGEDGRFEDYPLDAYWSDATRIPLLIRRERHPIGFALLNAESHSGRAAAHNMAEFFIVRKHRRGGAGTDAARAIFDTYPGQWDVAVARRNVAALAFWRKAIAGHPRVFALEEVDVATKDWNGPIIRFRIGTDP